jgi:hypothetical protein
MFRESAFTKPLPPEDSPPSRDQLAMPPAPTAVASPFVAQRAVDMDAKPAKIKVIRKGVGKDGFGFYWWCLGPAVLLIAWCVIHATLARAASRNDELIFAVATGVVSFSLATILSWVLSKLFEPGRVASSVSFCAVVMIAAMSGSVRLIVNEPDVARATALSALVLQPLDDNSANMPEYDSSSRAAFDGRRNNELTMEDLATKMRQGTIEVEESHVDAKTKNPNSKIRMTVRKKKPEDATSGELADAPDDR